MYPGGRKSRSTLDASVVLPQPDSPAIPRISPRFTVRSTWSTAVESPLDRLVPDGEVRDLQDRRHFTRPPPVAAWG